jgi:hypothetical protein
MLYLTYKDIAMAKLSANFEIPSDTMPEAFSVSRERATELGKILGEASKNSVERHSMAEDTTLDHVLADIMRDIDSKTTLEDNERDMMLLQLGANLGFIRNAIGEARGMREMKRAYETLSDEDKAAIESERKKMRMIGGRLAQTIASVLNDDPSDHNFSNN